MAPPLTSRTAWIDPRVTSVRDELWVNLAADGGLYARFLYFTRGKGREHGDFVAAQEAPSVHWELDAKIPGNLTRSATWEWIRDRVGRLPILAPEES